MSNCNCVTANILRLAWQLSTPDVKPQKLAEYRAHRETCPVCREAMRALVDQASQASMPEVDYVEQSQSS
jgi:hypothetical protein